MFSAPCPGRQRGIVLVVALLMLVILSVLASMSIRGASSTEQLSNRSRLRLLAQQNAEAALRFCEQQVQLHASDSTKGFAPEAAPALKGEKFNWENIAAWDDMATAGVSTKVMPRLVAVDAAGDTATGVYFRRPPECMSQYLASAGPQIFVTTARGFGPDVAPKHGSVTDGTEFWLQSMVTLNSSMGIDTPSSAISPAVPASAAAGLPVKDAPAPVFVAVGKGPESCANPVYSAANMQACRTLNCSDAAYADLHRGVCCNDSSYLSAHAAICVASIKTRSWRQFFPRAN